MNLSPAIIEKSLKLVDSDCISFGVLDSSIVIQHKQSNGAVFPKQQHRLDKHAIVLKLATLRTIRLVVVLLSGRLNV